MAQLVKTIGGLAIASVKTVNDLAIASVKTVGGLDNTSGGGPPFSDNFTYSNGNLATVSSGLWVDTNSTVVVSSNAVTGTSGQNSFAVYNTSMGTTDHVSRCVLSTLTASGDNAGPMARASNSAADGYCYFAFGTGDTLKLYRVNGGSFTLLSNGSVGAAAQGDTLAIEVSGTGATVTIKCYRNGSLDTSIGTAGVYLDTAAGRLTAGNYAGVAIFSTSHKVDNWSAATGAGP